MSDYRSEAAAAFPLRASDAINHKAWAQRIMYREAKGDTELTALQVAFAREAIDGPEKPKS